MPRPFSNPDCRYLNENEIIALFKRLEAIERNQHRIFDLMALLQHDWGLIFRPRDKDPDGYDGFDMSRIEQARRVARRA